MPRKWKKKQEETEAAEAPPKRIIISYPRPSWRGGHKHSLRYKDTLTPAELAYWEAYWEEVSFKCAECREKKRWLSLSDYDLTVEQVLHIVNSPDHQEHYLKDKLTEEFINEIWDLYEKLAGQTLVWSEVWKEFNSRRPSLRLDDSRLYYLDYLVVKEGSWEHTLIEMDAVADFQPEELEEGTRTPEEVVRYKKKL